MAELIRRSREGLVILPGKRKIKLTDLVFVGSDLFSLPSTIAGSYSRDQQESQEEERLLTQEVRAVSLADEFGCDYVILLGNRSGNYVDIPRSHIDGGGNNHLYITNFYNNPPAREPTPEFNKY